MKKRNEEPKQSTLTDKMDYGTQGFDDFQAILLKKSKERTDFQRKKIELLTLKYQMEDYLNSDNSEEKTAGDFLYLILKTLKIQQKQFADYIGLKPSNLNKLIKGERTINYDLAIIFGRIFNMNPMLWIEIQAKNELNKLREAESDKYSDYKLNDLIRHKNAG